MIKASKNDPETIIFVFIDGIGIGLKNSDTNPFTRYGKDFFSALGGKSSFTPPGILIPADAHMSLYSTPPQSGTGQAALFTGYNTISLVHRHMSGFPPFSLRPYLKNKSIIHYFLQNSLKASVINTYTKKYLEILGKPRSERFMSASTMMQTGSGQRLLSVDDLLEEKSIFMDITNWFLRKELGYKVPEILPDESGRRLVRLASDYNLVVFEYFFPDKYGHDSEINDVEFIVDHLEGFLKGIWEELDPSRQLVVVSSDHGNFEDLSIPVHTHNMIPAIFYGCGQSLAPSFVREIYDVPRFLLSLKKIEFHENKKKDNPE
ncbi:MAG: hypothetical protein OEV66_07375 [Spirochaetia bacterium]|nr:hypothetical protein [Spirochaetia bacterium]